MGSKSSNSLNDWTKNIMSFNLDSGDRERAENTVLGATALTAAVAAPYAVPAAYAATTAGLSAAAIGAGAGAVLGHQQTQSAERISQQEIDAARTNQEAYLAEMASLEESRQQAENRLAGERAAFDTGLQERQEASATAMENRREQAARQERIRQSQAAERQRRIEAVARNIESGMKRRGQDTQLQTRGIAPMGANISRAVLNGG